MAFFKKEDEKIEEEKIFVESEKRFHDIFEQSGMGVSIVDLNGYWLEVNDRLCAITGYSKKELLAKKFADITHPDDVKKSLEAVGDLVSGKIPYCNLEKRYICKNKNVIWVFLSISVFRNHDGKPHYFIVHTQDITEFKNIEQELHDSEEKYRTIIEKGSDGILIIQDALIKFANSMMLEMAGYKEKEIIGKSFLSFIAPEFLDLIKDKYAKRLEGKGSEARYEVEIIKKDGQKIPVEIGGSLIAFEGKPADMVFLRDITERRKSEEETKIYKFIVEQSHQQIAFASLEGTLLFVNKSFAEGHGYDAKELIGKNLSVAHPKEELANVQNANKILLKKGKFNGEIIHKRKDGSIYPTIMDNFVLTIDSKPKYIVGMAIDITKVKEAEEEVKKQKSLLDSIVASTNDGLFVIDREGKVIFFNDKFRSFWKISAELIKTRDDKKLLDYVVGQLANPKEFLEKVKYLYDHPEEESSDLIIFKDGRVFERFSIPQKIDGNVVGRIWSFRDVTEKSKALEQEKERVLQIERINRLTVGRELKMVELKQEIAELKKKITE